jgi:hypothetical protein
MSTSPARALSGQPHRRVGDSPHRVATSQAVIARRTDPPVSDGADAQYKGIIRPILPASLITQSAIAGFQIGRVRGGFLDFRLPVRHTVRRSLANVCNAEY